MPPAPHPHNPPLTWTEKSLLRQARWISVDRRPPATVHVADNGLSADRALHLAAAGAGLLWRGDYHQARQLLDALRRRTRPGAPGRALPVAAALHRERQQRARTARLLAAVLIELEPGGHLALRRAPDTTTATTQVYGPITTPSLVPLRELLGVLNAERQRRDGIAVAALDGARIHPHYGVFAPTRQDYLDLAAAAPLPPRAHDASSTAFDIGAGTGVLSALLINRGIAAVTATDNQPRAVACARDNLTRLGLADVVTVDHRDLFPPGRADLIVANPPWLPGTPASAIETGVYDHRGAMTNRFLRGLHEHLRPEGQAWLIQSTLAELLGLRRSNDIPDLIDRAGLQVKELHQAASTQRRPTAASAGSDPVAHARTHEQLQLWRLSL